MFKKYEIKLAVVEAVQFTDENKNSVFNSLTGQIAPSFEYGNPTIKITTISGDIAIVRFGDWIVKENREGFYYSVDADSFELKYSHKSFYDADGEYFPSIGDECEFESEGHHDGWKWCIFRGFLSDGGHIVEFHHDTAPGRVTCDCFDPDFTRYRKPTP